MSTTDDVQALRDEASVLLETDGHFMTRSCWECNRAHDHLRTVDDAVILCFVCGHYFFRGTDITEPDA